MKKYFIFDADLSLLEVQKHYNINGSIYFDHQVNGSALFSEYRITPDTNLVLLELDEYTLAASNAIFIIADINDISFVKEDYSEKDYHYKISAVIYTEEYFTEIKATIQNNEEIETDRASMLDSDDQYDDTWYWTFIDFKRDKNKFGNEYIDEFKNYKYEEYLY